MPLLFTTGCTQSKNEGTSFLPPKTKQINQTFSHHYINRVDYYHWLSREQDPEVASQIDQENNYSLKMFAYYQKKTSKRLSKPIKVSGLESTTLLPFIWLGWEYFLEYDTKNHHPIICRSKEKLKEAVFNVNSINFFSEKEISLTTFEPSLDGNFLIIGFEAIAHAQHALFLINMSDKNKTTHTLPGVKGPAFWGRTGKAIYYIDTNPETKQDLFIKKTIFNGTDTTKTLYEEPDNTRQLKITKSASGHFLFLNSFDRDSNDIFVLSLQSDMDTLQPIISKNKEMQYSIDHQDNLFFLVSNKNSIYSSSSLDKEIETWKTMPIPLEDSKLGGAVFPKEHFVIKEQVNSSVRFRAINHYNQEPYNLSLIPLTVNGKLLYNLDHQSSVTVATQSPIHPVQITSYDLINQTNELHSKKTLSPNKYQSQYLQIKSTDGTPLPIMIYHKKEFNQTEHHAAILTFCISADEPDPYRYNPAWEYFLENDIILVVTSIRSIQHQNSHFAQEEHLLERQNSIYDLITCAESLINQRWVHPDRLAVIGFEESAWTIAAAMNMRPSLFACVVLYSPVTDPMSLLIDNKDPLNSRRQKKWGNPTDKDDFDILLKISPYDQLEPKDYPPVLIVSSQNHLRVPFWQSLKWGSKLRLLNTKDSVVIIYTQAEKDETQLSGDQIATFQRAFLFNYLGFI